MKTPNPRRTFLLAASFAAATLAAPASAQPMPLHGEIAYAGGGLIPAGEIEIRLEGSASRNGADPAGATARVRSDGKSKTLGFTLPAPVEPSVTPEVVALLARPDGWLLARGSTPLGVPAAGLRIVLETAMY